MVIELSKYMLIWSNIEELVTNIFQMGKGGVLNGILHNCSNCSDLFLNNLCRKSIKCSLYKGDTAIPMALLI